MNWPLAASAVALVVRWSVRVFLPALLLAGGALPAFAQAPGQAPGQAPAAPGQAPGAPAAGAAPAGGGSGQIQYRISLPLIDQYSYTNHPFYQITEDSAYLDGKAGSAALLGIGGRSAGDADSTLLKLIHTLPSFGFEGVRRIGFNFPRGVGIGFDSIPIVQADTEAAAGATTGEAIEMDSYYYSIALRFYFFDPTERGINYFVGLSLGVLAGTLRAEPSTATGGAQFVDFGQYPVGSTRLGLESRGETWGFRYELMVIGAKEVSLKHNPYPDVDGDGSTPTQIDFSGTLVRMSLLYQF